MTDILEGGDPVAEPVVPATPVVDPVLEQPTAPAPVETPKPATEPESPDDEITPVSYEPSGDVGLDLALEFFGKLGLSLESPEMQEAGRGNFEYLEAKLAALGEKAVGSERYLALARDAHTRMATDEKVAFESRRDAVYEAVGGEENWKQVQEFVTANADPEEMKEVKGAIMQGGVVAKAMAEHLHRTYLAASGTSSEPASPTRHQATNPVGGAPLTRAGYLQEVNSLVAKLGSHRMDGSPEYAALRARYANVK